MPTIAARLRSTFVFRSRPAGYADAHGNVPLPLSTPALASAVALDRGDDPPGGGRVSERDHYPPETHSHCVNLKR
jgi:hypothetical protein